MRVTRARAKWPAGALVRVAVGYIEPRWLGIVGPKVRVLEGTMGVVMGGGMSFMTGVGARELPVDDSCIEIVGEASTC